MARDEPEVGDKVSWNWGGGAPGGKVANKKDEGEIAIKSKRGNTIKKNAEPDNPAVHIERSGNDVVKRASELNVEKKASGGKRKAEQEEGDEEDDEPHVENKDGNEVKPGGKDKNKAEMEEKKANGTKKQKTSASETKKAGRPKKPEGTGSGKQKKASGPRAENTISSRTRSRNK